MTGIASTGAKPDFIEGQGQVIKNHQQVLNIYLFLVHPVFDRPSTQVHICGRTNTNKASALPFYFRSKSQAVGFELSTMFCYKCHHHIKPNVMTGMCIFSS